MGNPSPAPLAPTMLCAKAVAACLGYDVGTIYRKVRRGELPAVRIGRSLRFRADEIHRLVQGGDK